MRLIKILKKTLAEEDRRDDGSRFSLLYKAATDVFGKGILTQLRDRELVIGRRMISYKMRQEGFSISAIANKLYRHHTSIVYGIRMMQDAIDFQFKEELELWNKFNQKVEEYEKEISSEVV